MRKDGNSYSAITSGSVQTDFARHKLYIITSRYTCLNFIVKVKNIFHLFFQRQSWIILMLGNLQNKTESITTLNK